MVESRRRLRFVDESLFCVRIAREAGRQELQRDNAVETQIDGFVDHSHPAAAEPLNDAIVGNGLSNERGLVHVFARRLVKLSAERPGFQ